MSHNTTYRSNRRTDGPIRSPRDVPYCFGCGASYTSAEWSRMRYCSRCGRNFGRTRSPAAGPRVQRPQIARVEPRASHVLQVVGSGALHAGSLWWGTAKKDAFFAAITGAAAGGLALGVGTALIGVGATMASIGFAGSIIGFLVAVMCVVYQFSSVAETWFKIAIGFWLLSLLGALLGTAGSILVVGGQVLLAGSAVVGAFGAYKAIDARREALREASSPDAPRTLITFGSPTPVLEAMYKERA